MPSTTQPQDLQHISHALDLAISQCAVFNLYVDAQLDDSHLSNCLLGLQNDLQAILSNLHQYQSTAIAPSVEVISHG